MMFMYNVVGGELNKFFGTREEVEMFSDSVTPDRSYLRRRGALVCSELLDNQPQIPGYCGPMLDGKRFMGTDGKWHYEFEKGRYEAAEPYQEITVIRYESQDVYDALSN